jgi:peptidase E
MKPRQIVAMGGGVLAPDSGNFKLEEYIIASSRAQRPRICYVSTASGDDAAYVARFYESYGRFDVRLKTLPFFRRTPADLRAFLFECDVVHVGGGNTRSMLAVWRHWNFDQVLREAYERGIVLCGSSAGAICWFESGVTDSVAGDLTPMECLGILPGSNCPHYDAEKERRPSYQRMVREGLLPGGLACDDGAGAHFIDGSLARVVSARENARAYRVERTGKDVHERPLDVVTL